MKNSKLLNKKNLSIILLFLFFGIEAKSQEPVDIWNAEVKQETETAFENDNLEKKPMQQNTIYKMQSLNGDKLNIEEDQTLISKKKRNCWPL